jgi:hypothetical protein
MRRGKVRPARLSAGRRGEPEEMGERRAGAVRELPNDRVDAHVAALDELPQ